MALRAEIAKHLKELRILFCHSSPSSSVTREFVEQNYKNLKTLNPKLPILIREGTGINPQIWARYDLGVERSINLEGLKEPQIWNAVDELVKIGKQLQK